MATWRLPLRKIVISRWLLDVARSMGESAEYIPNGLDFEAFGLDVDPQSRSPFSTLMLYHQAEWKGTADGLDALARVKQRVPELEATLFGVPTAPSTLPPWVRYYRQPAQTLLRSLYNHSAIFVSPSRSEGWGLTASEALMCGCALAATDAGGHREFALHEETALVSPPANPEALAKNIERLLSEPERRTRLARTGHQFIGQFTWERALDAFERLILLRQSPDPISRAAPGTGQPTFGSG
jgi:glycosyltransferase involved in cell wall biosynthesis